MDDAKIIKRIEAILGWVGFAIIAGLVAVSENDAGRKLIELGAKTSLARRKSQHTGPSVSNGMFS